ncbi:hypothetical protein ACE6H2_010807 [Prunus campanulata]
MCMSHFFSENVRKDCFEFLFIYFYFCFVFVIIFVLVFVFLLFCLKTNKSNKFSNHFVL